MFSCWVCDAKSGLVFSLDTLGMGFLKQDELFEILINKFPREQRDRWWGTPGMSCGVGGIVPAGVQGTGDTVGISASGCTDDPGDLSQLE